LKGGGIGHVHISTMARRKKKSGPRGAGKENVLSKTRGQFQGGDTTTTGGGTSSQNGPPGGEQEREGGSRNEVEARTIKTSKNSGKKKSPRKRTKEDKP